MKMRERQERGEIETRGGEKLRESNKRERRKCEREQDLIGESEREQQVGGEIER